MTTASELDGFRVLVVEDEALVAMVIEDMLAGFGCKVVGPAANVDEALGLLAAAGIDGALVDVNLGGEQLGFRVADALASRAIPYVFASGYGRSILTSPHLDAPVLPKPFDEQMLREAVRTLIRRRST
jgi:CheY-like chemotaxis protein